MWLQAATAGAKSSLFLMDEVRVHTLTAVASNDFNRQFKLLSHSKLVHG